MEPILSSALTVDLASPPAGHGWESVESIVMRTYMLTILECDYQADLYFLSCFM